MPASLKRKLAVTAALSGVGAVCGAVLGTIALWVEIARLPGVTSPNEILKVAFVGVLGGVVFGAVLAPLVAWAFLRRVSFGRAILETSIGVLIGIGVGALVRPQYTILTGLVGFVVAGARLWWATRASSASRAEAT